MAGRLIAIAFAVAIIVLWPTPAQAHSLGSGYFAHRVEVKVEPEWIHVVYATEIPLSVLQREFVRAMLEEPAGADGEQIRARLRQQKAELLKGGIEIALNGARLQVEDDPAHPQETRPNDELFLLFRYHLRAPTQGRLLDRNQLVIRNRNYARQQAVFSHSVELAPEFGSLRTGLEADERSAIDPRTGYQWFYSGKHRNLNLTFERGGAQAPAAATPAGDGSAPEAVEGESTIARLERFLQAPGLSARWVLLALVVAFFLGAAHALSPGHGKTVVAAYLVGSKGRVRDAVVLGTTVTLTHTSTVFLLGIVTLFLSQYVLPERLYPYLTLASGLLVVAVGVWMLRQRLRAARQDHSHAHDHSHAPAGKVTLSSLVSLGVSGGLVPCPSALVVLLTAIAYQRLGLGLGLVLSFSLGLASVLIAIGIFMVLAGRIARKIAPSGAWVRWLPVFSSLVIIALGFALCWKPLQAMGVFAG